MKGFLVSIIFLSISTSALGATHECKNGSEVIKTPMPCDQYFALFPPKAPKKPATPDDIWKKKREERARDRRIEIQHEKEKMAREERERREEERQRELYIIRGYMIDRVYSPVRGYLSIVVKAKRKVILNCHALSDGVFVASGRYVVRPPATEITMHIGRGVSADEAECNRHF